MPLPQHSLNNQQILEKSAIKMMQEIEKQQVLENAKQTPKDVSREIPKN